MTKPPLSGLPTYNDSGGTTPPPNNVRNTMHTQDIKYQLLPQTYTHEEWLQQRQTGIGSSEASIILGLSNYESPYSLWEIKTGRAYHAHGLEEQILLKCLHDPK